MSQRSVVRVCRDVGWALGWSLGAFALLGGFVAVMTALSGGRVRLRSGRELTLGQVVVTYLIAGIILGLVVGLLRPLTKTREGVWLVSAIAGGLTFPSFGVLVYGPPQAWNVAVLIGSIVIGIALGIGMGDHIYKDHLKRQERESSP